MSVEGIVLGRSRWTLLVAYNPLSEREGLKVESLTLALCFAGWLSVAARFAIDFSVRPLNPVQPAESANIVHYLWS